ncbi:hypothetical protein I79_002110 [Cricetulus griseus]|uniref:Uncharacterized protein n=1 Tax=Cricetulus griseus TaxID=10029 RepID=G3GWI5_CRIGR|nr:hypothetical protein I79_002110 [Cricetulus griseus]
MVRCVFCLREQEVGVGRGAVHKEHCSLMTAHAALKRMVSISFQNNLNHIII